MNLPLHVLARQLSHQFTVTADSPLVYGPTHSFYSAVRQDVPLGRTDVRTIAKRTPGPGRGSQTLEVAVALRSRVLER